MVKHIVKDCKKPEIKLKISSSNNICWYSFIKVSSYESALICLKPWVTNWSEIIWTLRYSIISKWLSSFSGQWLVAGPVNGCVYINFLQSNEGLGIELPPVLFWSASWTLVGAPELVCVFVIVVYSARKSSDF